MTLAPEADTLQHLGRKAPGLSDGPPIPSLAEQSGGEHILDHTHADQRLNDLERSADAEACPVMRPRHRDFAMAKMDLSFDRFLKTADQLQQRRLTRSVRSDQA